MCKSGILLAVTPIYLVRNLETTIDDPSGFKVFRTKEGDGDGAK